MARGAAVAARRAIPFHPAKATSRRPASCRPMPLLIRNSIRHHGVGQEAIRPAPRIACCRSLRARDCVSHMTRSSTLPAGATTTSDTLPAAHSGTFLLGGDLPVHRIRFGAVRLTGKGIWGPPADRAEAIPVLRRAVALGLNLIDTAGSSGPEPGHALTGGGP